MNTQPTALDAYLARAAAIHIKLARLRQLADDHFGHGPEAIHCGATSVTLGGWIRLWTICCRSSTVRQSEGATMDTLPKLSPAQSLLLRAAARRADGHVIPPDTLRGGARAKVLTTLLQRGWIEPADGGHVLTDAGYVAIGQQRPAPPDDVQPMDTISDLQLLEGISVRPGTKLAALVMALRRPQGATSLQLMLATGWQPHTVRRAISGMLRKKLGLTVVLAHNDTGERVYRVV